MPVGHHPPHRRADDHPLVADDHPPAAADQPPDRRVAPKRSANEFHEGMSEAKRRYQPLPLPSRDTEHEDIEVDVDRKRSGDGLQEDGPSETKKPCVGPSLCSELSLKTRRRN